ncbi:MAG: hypothetical protein NVS2B17_30700 [Candidatus Velthaea sp.]
MYDLKDERGVPISSGIPPIVKWSAIIGVLMIFTILAMCIFGSSYHHIWPALDTTKIKLG